MHTLAVINGVIGVAFLLMDIFIVFVTIRHKLQKILLLYPLFNLIFYVSLILVDIVILQMYGLDEYLIFWDVAARYTFIVYVLEIIFVGLTLNKLKPGQPEV